METAAQETRGPEKVPRPKPSRRSSQDSHDNPGRRGERGPWKADLAGLAHELLNHLNIICMEVHLCLARLKEAEPRLVKGLTRIEQRARRIEGILRALLGATRPADVSPRPALLNEVVLEAVGLLEAGLESAKIDVHLDMDPRLQPVEMVEAQLTQAVLNILLNAKDAMPEGGRLLVRTRQMEPPEPSRGPLVELRVEDSGPGIAPEHMPRLFEPYFTTKKEGSGLGLYIAKLIVESHEGEIRAESAPGQGAAFIIRLPASGDPSGEAM